MGREVIAWRMSETENPKVEDRQVLCGAASSMRKRDGLVRAAAMPSGAGEAQGRRAREGVVGREGGRGGRSSHGGRPRWGGAHPLTAGTRR